MKGSQANFTNFRCVKSSQDVPEIMGLNEADCFNLLAKLLSSNLSNL